MNLTEKAKTEIAWFTCLVALVGMLGGMWQSYQRETSFLVLANDNPTEFEPVPTDIPSPTPTPQFDNEIETYVYEVFGDHYEKAMLLLKGNEECGGENKGLDPYAVNENRREDGTVWSRDRGIFQINDVFHPLTDEQAFDYKENIDYAWRMYENDSYSFKRWTAGRCIGI